MSKGFIGLDNPSFQGNLRTYRRREVVRPQSRQQVQSVPILDDVMESSAAAQKVVQSKAIPKQINQHESYVNINNSPLQSPAWHTRPAGAEIMGTANARPQRRLSRSEQFEDWKRKQLEAQTNSELQEIPVVYEAQTTEFAQSSPQEYDPADYIKDYDYPEGEVLVQKQKLRTRLFRRIPFFGNLNRKDMFTLRFAMPAMAVTIFLVGCGVAVQGVMTNRHVKAQVAQLAGDGDVTGYDASGEPEVPDETKPDEKSYGPYVVAPDMPKYIRINKIGVTSRVMRVGVKPNNELIAPNNIHTVGWYEGSSKPGEPGTALLDAHVHGPTQPGAFYKINKLSPGDGIEIEMGDGRKLSYSVVGNESTPYDKVDMAKAMRSAQNGKNGLNLITCGGKYNKSTHMYEERTIVYAVQN